MGEPGEGDVELVTIRGYRQIDDRPEERRRGDDRAIADRHRLGPVRRADVEGVLARRDRERRGEDVGRDAVDDGVLLGVHDIDQTPAGDGRVDARAGPGHDHRGRLSVERDRVGGASAKIQVEKVDPIFRRHEDVVVLIAGG